MFDPYTILLQGEDPGHLPHLMAEARDYFQPANGFEQAIVDCLPVLTYRQSRIALFESRLLTFQRRITPKFLLQQWPDIDESGRNTLAFTRMRTKIRDLLSLEMMLARLFHQTLRNLEALRKLVKPARQR